MSTINDFGIPGIGNGILQPKLKHRWRVTFANMGGGEDSQPVSMQAVTVSRPKLTFEKIPLHRYNSVAMIPTKHSWTPMQLTIEDDITSSASTIIQAQLQKQQWLIGAEGAFLAASGEGSLFKFVSYLELLDGSDQVVERWTVEGCFIEDVDYGEMSYTTGEAMTISLTISYDHARQNLTGYDRGPGVATGGAGRA